METNSKNTGVPTQQKGPAPGSTNRWGKAWGGLIIVLIGVLLLADRTGFNVPDWILSFETLLLVLGFYIGLRHSFRGFAWLVPILIGGLLLVDDVYPNLAFKDYGWPLLVIGLGLFITLRSFKGKADGRRCGPMEASVDESSDVLDSTVIFGGAKKNFISKNFLGGEAVTVFGGTELNLMQAELTQPVVLELTQVFGGTKLIVPSHWKVQSKEMVAILGGIDDKRPVLGNADDNTNQILILKGTCVLGGIEIRSY